VVRSISSTDRSVRSAALEAIVQFPADQAAGALRPLSASLNLDVREDVISTLASRLKQPVDFDLFIPAIQRHKNKGPIAIERLLVLRDVGDAGATTLLRCLDFDNPSPDGHYNWSLIDWQTSLQNPLVIPWISHDGQAGPEEIAQNRRTLKQIKAWLDYCQQHPQTENRQPEIPQPGIQSHAISAEEEKKLFGPEVDALSIRARVLRTIWPEGLPQLIAVNARVNVPEPPGADRIMHRMPAWGLLPLRKKPAIVEIEVNGEWYTLPAGANLAVNPRWDPRHPGEFEFLPIDARWHRKSDEQPLKLPPGKYTIRVGISQSTEEDRKLAMSLPVKFEVIVIDQE
jgi:hypothetical protein